jgi:type I restriction enzyme S subunit
VIPKLGDKGRMAVMKGGYLAEAHCGMNDIGGRYQRYAAGPYDSSLIAAMERGADDLCGIKTIEPPGDGDRVIYQVPQSMPSFKADLETLVGEDRANAFSKMLSDLDGIGREGIEAVATIYAVWKDRIAAGKTADDDAICNGVLNDWHEEKRQKFNRAGLDHWLDWMRRNGFVPNGTAPRTDHQGNLFA